MKVIKQQNIHDQDGIPVNKPAFVLPDLSSWRPRVRTQDNTRGIYGGQSVTEAVVSPSTSVFLNQYQHTNVLYL